MTIMRCVSFVLLGLALVAADHEMKMGVTTVHIGDSGEMEFLRQMNGSEEAHPVKISMDEIVQVDSNGNALTECAEPTDLTQSGTDWTKSTAKTSMMTNMKTFHDFENQKFDFGEETHSSSMPHGGDMKASTQRFSASLPDGVGKMAIDMALPEEDGEIDVAGEKQRLRKGDMKFNIEMSEWMWCDNAAFVDVYIKVSGRHAAERKHARNSTAPAAYDLGDNVTMSFSGKFLKDAGAWAEMTEGFPKVDPNDATRFIVRFPRFNETLVYDPTVAGDDDGAADDVAGSSGVSGLSVSAILITMATSAICAMAMLK